MVNMTLLYENNPRWRWARRVTDNESYETRGQDVVCVYFAGGRLGESPSLNTVLEPRSTLHIDLGRELAFDDA